ncbi:MAG: carboxypeptidase-like regulatory domain-containing protein [Odoribacter sp.]|nr:carboxypeptidase-like regulatory domain-containing protein [Odoribacter sp.]
MKKIIIAMMALAATSASMAKTADELRIYINPGHGSYTPNDRPQTLVGHKDYSRTNTDTTNFFESNTNLRKGFGVLEKLRTYGLKFDPTLNQEGDRHMIGAARDLSNNIVMSHVKCGPYLEDNGTENQFKAENKQVPVELYWYNRNLSEICEEVEANHFDMFISIHSNAATEGTSTNYPLFLYRGYDNLQDESAVTAEHQTISRAMADACWGYAFENPHMMWTSYSATSKNIRGDINFYGSSSTSKLGYKGYLGVLKHSAPGFLVEGYFHTYQAARHRAMNWDVDYMEGAAYAHGIADYFKLTKENTGDIYGIVRDANERFSDTYYKPNTSTLDRFLPINGCVAILKKDGTEVARYTTDSNYNGAFVFKNVEAGVYTIEFEHESYLAADPVSVEVKAAQISYPTAQLVNKDWKAPEVTYVDYPDPLATFNSILPAKEYNLSTEYADEPIAQLEGKIIRRTIVRDQKMYVLAYDKELTLAANIPVEDQAHPTILVYDLDKKEVVAEISTEGAAGSIAAVGDIQLTADGILLACNATKNQSEGYVQEGDAGRGTFYIYKWENDENGLPTGDPAVAGSTQNAGNWYRAYLTRFAYTGTLTEGKAVIPAPTITAPAYSSRGIILPFMDGEAQAVKEIKPANRFSLGDTSSDMALYISPISTDEVITLDATTGANYWAIDDIFNLDTRKTGNESFGAANGNAGLFKYAGATFVAMPLNEEDGNKGLQLINMTAGVEKATPITLNTDVVPAEAAATAAAGEVVATYDEFNGFVTGGWINLYLLRDGKITKLTTKNVEQPQGRREYAYDLKSEESEDAFTVTFNATGDAPEAYIVMTPDEGETITQPIGAVVKGENTVVVAKSDLDASQGYRWEIQVVSDPISQAGAYITDASGLIVRGSVITITDPEAASYGYVGVGHGSNKGIDIYNPAGEKVATRLFVDNKELGGVTTNVSNPIRGDEHNGYFVFATWGDTGYGAVAVNPLNTEEAPFTLFAGEKKSAGHFMYNGVNLGGGTSGITFIKQGDEDYMLSFSEDHEGSNGSGATENSLVKYHMSSPWEITEAPVVIGYKSFLSNTNVDLVAYGNGTFVSQVRGAGNNQASVPCFGYISNVLTAPDVTMTSADDNIVDYVDNNTSGLAVSVDGTMLAAALTNKIVVFDVEWNGETPVLTYKYSFPVDTHVWSTMRFDAAGNLHTYLREGGYRAYSLPAERPVAVTPAAKQYYFGEYQAVTEISASEAATADAVYYNLQGVRVDAGNLTPGVYVKVSGATATKVLVK